MKDMLISQLKEGSHFGKTHLALYPVNFVLGQIGRTVLELHGCKVRMGSVRYYVFAHSTICVDCGVEGIVMALDQQRAERKKAHFNLYGIKHNGQLVLMTKDHIIPVSKGGPNHKDNYQTMCHVCNKKKGVTTWT